MATITIPSFSNKADRNDWLVENKSLIIAEKKASMKEADAVGVTPGIVGVGKDGVEKALPTGTLPADVDKIRAKLVINTTNVIDSHMDCHIPGLWKKTISEQSEYYLTQEHRLSFDKVITEEVKCFTYKMSWASIGAPFKGSTEALMFDAVIGSRNEYMKGQYAKGYVKNHSVGMRYVKIYMCINDERYPEYKAMWDKYIGEVHNREAADESGYFWAVTEAKIVEGSAVVRGSNIWTPIMSMSAMSDDAEIKEEPADEATTNKAKGSAPEATEPPPGTQKQEDGAGIATSKTFINANLY